MHQRLLQTESRPKYFKEMIPDKLFKSLKHSCEGFNVHLNGQTLETGYKPDFVLKKANHYIIIESENSSSRKTFVGGMIKAAHFLQGNKRGQLIFVMVPKKNTTASSLAKHLKPYLKWIEGYTNLKNVYIIESDYYYKKNVVLNLDCIDFQKLALKV